MNPDDWIYGLEILRIIFEISCHPISEMDLIIHIMHSLPDQYETSDKFIETELEDEFAVLDQVREKLRNKFEWLNQVCRKRQKCSGKHEKINR